MRRRILALAFATTLAAGSFGGSHRARADAFLTVTGTLNGELNTTPIADGTAFTATADLTPSSNGPPPGSGYAVYYPSTLTFSVQGVGALEPMTGITVALLSSPNPPGIVLYMVGGTLNMFFNSVSQFYLNNSDVLETLYSGETSFTQSGNETLALSGGSRFTISQFDSTGTSVALFAPEPGSVALLASGVLGLAALAGRRRRQQPRVHPRQMVL